MTKASKVGSNRRYLPIALLIDKVASATPVEKGDGEIVYHLASELNEALEFFGFTQRLYVTDETPIVDVNDV